MPPNHELSISKLTDDVQLALKQWRNEDAAHSISYLLLFRQIQQAEPGTLRETADRLLLTALTALEAENPRGTTILRMRFLDKITVDGTANQLNLEASTIYGLQNTAIMQLGKLVHKLEVQARTAQASRMMRRLEAPTYNELIGVAGALAELIDVLTNEGPPWLVAIEGAGGIGKTALTTRLMHTLVQDAHWTAIGWVTARQSTFDMGGGLRSVEQPALTTSALTDQLVAQLTDNDPLYTTLSADRKASYLETQLKQQPHLIVIDNLETFHDITTLLPFLRRLINPSKFLLTTREHIASEPGIFHFKVPPLGPADALQLIRQEARQSNLPQMANASAAELQPIYDTVGGNPLALRLVVGQTYAHSLAVVLADLKAAQGTPIEKLYEYLYLRAWQSLDQPTRELWLRLPLLVGPLANEQILAQLSGQTPTAVRTSLARLVQLNLVDCHGDLNMRYYSLHSLTRTFLQQKMANWL